MKFINGSIYGHGTSKISNFSDRLLHLVLVCAPATILTIFFCKVNIFPQLEDSPPKNSDSLLQKNLFIVAYIFLSVGI
jgi:hypothetical protein